MTGDLPEDRMPPIPAERMTEAQRQAAAELVAGPRGAVAGPFIPLLRSPELLNRLQRTGEYLRFHSALPPRLLELAILLLARQWTQQFEWATHQPLALRAGLKAEVTQAILEGRRPAGLSEGEETVADFLEELSRSRSVSDATYARAVALLGERGVVDLCGVAGYYTTLAMILNVARTPAPGGALGPLPHLPR